MFSASVAELMEHHSNNRNEMLLKYHKMINNTLGGSKRKSLPRKNVVFVLGNNIISMLFPFGLYGAGKKAHLHSNNADNLIQAESQFSIPEFPSLHLLQGNLGNPEIPECQKESN